MPEERQARSAAETRRLIDEMPLQELRWALERTQPFQRKPESVKPEPTEPAAT